MRVAHLIIMNLCELEMCFYISQLLRHPQSWGQSQLGADIMAYLEQLGLRFLPKGIIQIFHLVCFGIWSGELSVILAQRHCLTSDRVTLMWCLSLNLNSVQTAVVVSDVRQWGQTLTLLPNYLPWVMFLILLVGMTGMPQFVLISPS